MTATHARAMVQHGVRDLRAGDLPDPDDRRRRRAAAHRGVRHLRQRLRAVRRHAARPHARDPRPRARRHHRADRRRRRAALGRRARAIASRVETLIPCGYCHECVLGRYRLCRGDGRGLSAYGYRPVETPPSLWGGYAEYLYLEPHALVHKMSTRDPGGPRGDVQPDRRGHPLGGRTCPQLRSARRSSSSDRGSAGSRSVIAAREAGAGTIIVTGLSRDERKLALCRDVRRRTTRSTSSATIRVRVVREITDGALRRRRHRRHRVRDAGRDAGDRARATRRPHRARRHEGREAGARLPQRRHRRQGADDHGRARRRLAGVRGRDPAHRVRPLPARRRCTPTRCRWPKPNEALGFSRATSPARKRSHRARSRSMRRMAQSQGASRSQDKDDH